MSIFEEFLNTDLSGNETGLTKTDQMVNLIKEKGYNVDQMEAILRNEEKFQLIESVAGSGKTTALNFKVSTDIQSGRAWNKKIWVNTFLKSGAEEMKRDFISKIKDLGIAVPLNSITFGTIHSEFYRVLTALGLKIVIIQPDLDIQMKQTVSQDFNFGNYPGYLNQEEIQVLNSIETQINSHKEELSDEELMAMDLDTLGTTPSVIREAVRLLRERRESAGIYSYDDLQLIMYKYLIEKPVPALINTIQNKYDFIYMDEFQDTSSIQYEILKVYFTNATQVVMVGDSDQSIYSWRGADVSIITDKVVNELQADTKVLSINYRVPSVILDPIARSIAHNQNRIPKPIKAFKEGGILDLERFDDKPKLDEFIVKELIREVQSPEYDSIAVLSSTNADITELALNIAIMDTDDIVDYSIGGTQQDLNYKVYKDIWSVAKIFSKNPNEDLRRNLRTLSNNGIYKRKCTQIEEYLRNSNKSILDLSLNECISLIGDKSIYSWLSRLDDPNGQYQQSNRDPIVGIVETLRFMYIGITYQLEKSEKMKDYFKDKMGKILVFARLTEYREMYTAEDYLHTIKLLNESIKAKYKRTDTNLILTTPFDFKGKEADLVYVYNDIEGKFPRAKSLESKIEEERNLHYIVGTRAKKKCVYTTINGSESPFLKEMRI